MSIESGIGPRFQTTRGSIARACHILIIGASALARNGLKRAAGRRSLRDLSRGQLSDAGICLEQAGRGPAADTDPVVQTNLLSLR